MIVYVSIGNSDDKLTQERWADFVQDVDDTIGDHASEIHGRWFSSPAAPYQNACWCADVWDDEWTANMLKAALAKLAGMYDQDSIAWAEATTTLLPAAADA